MRNHCLRCVRAAAPTVLAVVLAWTSVLPAQQPTPTQPAEQTLEQLWYELAAEEPLKGYRAAWELARLAEQSVAFAGERVPAVSAEAAQVAQWIAQLDDDQYSRRQQASRELGALGIAAETALRQALEGEPSEETRARVEQLLEDLSHPERSADGRRMLRLVKALELIGTEPARALLERMASSAPLGGPQARAALERLAAEAPPRAQDRLYLMHWNAVLLDPALAESLLAQAQPLRPGENSTAYAVLRADGEALLSAVRAGVGRKDAMLLSTHGLQARPTSSPFHMPHWMMHEMIQVDRNQHVICMTSGQGQAEYISRWGRHRLELKDVKLKFEWGNQLKITREAELALSADLLPGQALCLLSDQGRFDAFHPHPLIVWQVVDVPPESDTTFYTLGTENWVRLGHAGMARLMAEGQQWNRQARESGHQIAPKWTRTLPNGGQVRVRAIRRPYRHPFQWWDGDGHPVDFEVAMLGSRNEQAVEVWVQTRDGDKAAWPNGGSGATLPADGKPLVVGVAAGEWTQAGTLKLNEAVEIDEYSYALRISHANEPSRGLFNQRSGYTSVELRYARPWAADVQLTVGAVDKHGKLHVPRSGTGSADPQLHIGKPSDTENMPRHERTSYAGFQFGPSQVERYVLLTRGYEWTEFTGIADDLRAVATQPARQDGP